MIAVDTNVLVYAHREDSEWHDAAFASVANLAQGRAAWAIPWPCIHEFLAIVTHPRIYTPASTVEEGIDQVDAWLESPTLTLLGESENHWQELRQVLRAAKIKGPQVHDARVAAICVQHGVRELWSADRDFARYPSLSVINPLVTIGTN